MHPRISIRGSVRPSVRPSVCPSVSPSLHWSVRRTVTLSLRRRKTVFRSTLCRVSGLVNGKFNTLYIASLRSNFLHDPQTQKGSETSVRLIIFRFYHTFYYAKVTCDIFVTCFLRPFDPIFGPVWVYFFFHHASPRCDPVSAGSNYALIILINESVLK